MAEAQLLTHLAAKPLNRSVPTFPVPLPQPMRLDTGQHMQLDQRMKLGPRMIQSMEVLQMPQAALEERIEQELGSNPTLEIHEPGADREALDQQRQQAERDDSESQRELVVSEDTEPKSSADDFERLSNFSEQYGESWDANAFEGGESYSGMTPRVSQGRSDDGEGDSKLEAMANAAGRTASLYDQLMDQWRLVETDPRTFAAGHYLIEQIDADGYLRTDHQTLSQNAPREIDVEHIDEALELLKLTLEPPGLAAADFRECLLLQMDALQRNDPHADLSLERTLVSEHLNDIEANRYPKIAKASGSSIERIKQAVTNLRQFHPHPGRLLARDEVHAITPDVVVELDEETDEYQVRLTRGRLPALYINRHYEQMSKDKTQDKKTRDFIGNNLRSASWLIDAVRQRNATLLRVSQVVIDAQSEFLEQGSQALRPLPMGQVADQLDVHLATVSRAVNEKYIQTPRGIFPLRMFFSGGTQTQSGESMSWAAIQAKLQALVNDEDKTKPLSDDELVAKLKADGIGIARRTVAKYRKQLNIPAARQRKAY